jgi:anhydro-N-acetylmuramic acid kinase
MLTAIGLMSGTSMDGIDAAMIRTDGLGRIEFGDFLTIPFEAGFRDRLRSVMGGAGAVEEVERELTDLHAEAVEALLAKSGMDAAEIDLVGFHGQTILHAPERAVTWQLGDGARLAGRVGIDVVNDFRSADVRAGGQGAPLVPLYHAALAERLMQPLAILNIGGVSNVTWIGRDGALMAFDTGPGNALIDDWMLRRRGVCRDEGGETARRGSVSRTILREMLAHPWFQAPPPKSLDRDAWNTSRLAEMPVEDGAATLTAFTAGAVALSRDFLPEAPGRWLVAGGGRHNRHLMSLLGDELGCAVDPVEAVGWQGDALEAQAFAYLAVRSAAGLCLSVPATTGVPAPMTGGRRHPATPAARP